MKKQRVLELVVGVFILVVIILALKDGVHDKYRVFLIDSAEVDRLERTGI